jgi:alkanesulfonate monooxygenase SsuD/methylene tetrahydromethanopterin reductase-like flavin-dependent oxidoreductase (luciferase family)
MKYGFVMPFGDPKLAVEVAKEVEAAGWDGFFVWESVWGVDAWASLAAVSMVTERVRLGTMLTPIARMRPWDLAGKTTTVDNLSNGRVILGVGLGAPDTGYAAFGEETDIRKRAEITDEGLDILTGLWKGQPFAYEGQHYTVRPTEFAPPPPPVQQPRIPIWMVGVWPKMKSMRRVLKYDGLIHQGDVAALKDARAWLEEHRESSGEFHYVCEGVTPGDDPAAQRAVVEPWLEAGATWYNESMWELPRTQESVPALLARVRSGPPRV